ncbi:MAG: hypothetical protein JWO38_5998 [Gemmataceae bacterium]|nr:hypothetical protein [Gemmataceae bacterium]
MAPVRLAAPSPLPSAVLREGISSPPSAVAAWTKMLPVLVWCGLALAVGVKAVISPNRHSVWPVFATASDHWRTGQSLYAYYPGLDMYRYSPTFAVAVAPLAALPVRLGGCVWGVGSVLLLYAALRALHREVLADEPGSPDRAAFLTIAAAGVAPMAWNLQSNALVLALAALGTTAAARGRWWRAAVLLAAPVFIKLWPLAWAAVVAAGRPRRLGPRLAVALAALAAIPALAASPETAAGVYQEWEYVLRVGQGLRWPGYRDLLTVWDLTGVPVDPLVYQVVQFAGGCGVVIASLAAGRRPGCYRRGLAVGLGAWLCWQLLLGPGSERNTYGLVIPVMGWEVLRARRAGAAWAWPGGALAVVVLFSSGDVERVIGQYVPGSTAVLPAAVAVFAGWMVFDGVRSAAGGRGQQPTPALVSGPWTALSGAPEDRPENELPRREDVHTFPAVKEAG